VEAAGDHLQQSGAGAAALRFLENVDGLQLGVGIVPGGVVIGVASRMVICMVGLVKGFTAEDEEGR
jgi:hypothetical protein